MRGGVFGNPHQFGGDPLAAFMPKKPIGTGGVFNGQFDDEPTAQPQQKKSGGFFGQGGAGRGIAGTIGDYLLQMSGARPIYAPAMQQKRAMDYQQKLMEQQRQAGREDKMWEWQNKPVAAPKATAFQQDYEYILANFGPEEAERFRNNKIDPPEWRQGADGRFYRVETAQPQVLGAELPTGWTIGN